MHFSNLLSLCALLLEAANACGNTCKVLPGIEVFPPIAQDGPANVQMTTCEKGFDGPKVQQVNETTYDWWYFDAVAGDGRASLVVIFFLQGPRPGLPGPSTPQVPLVQITGSFSNGTVFTKNLPADEAIVSTAGQGSSGLWVNSGVSWAGAPDLSKYRVTFNTSDGSLKGTFSLNSLAAPHAPCGPAEAGQALETIPGVGWANSIPDAHALINVEIDGSPLVFNGVGYHDKNWGVVPFNSIVGSWTWGHGRLGPYTVVWLDTLARDASSFPSGYVAYRGEIVNAECGTIKVRPIGYNSTYPPTATSGRPEAFSIEVPLSSGEMLKAEVRSKINTWDFPHYMRWVGTISGTVGNVSYQGVASYEMFNLF